jgi:hypothetical protein
VAPFSLFITSPRAILLPMLTPSILQVTSISG